MKEEIRDFVVAHKDNFEKKEKIYLKESDTDKTIEEIIVRDILTPYGSKKWVIVATKKQATIKHENGVYNVYSESGKCLGKGYKTKEEAEKRLKQVEYFKNKKAVTGTDYWGPKEIPDEEEEGTFIIRYYGGPGHIDYLRKSRNGKYHWVEQTHFDYINDKPFETTDYELAKKLVEQYGGEIEKKESKQVNNKRTSLKQVVISKMAEKTRKIKFKGIDNWNRPIFVDIDSLKKQDGSLNATKGFYITDLNNLFRDGTTEQEIKEFYKDKELNKILVYKGNYPNSEPMGIDLEKDTLILI